MTTTCSGASLAAGEVLAATAVTAQSWLLLEVPGAWPRDVGSEGALPVAAQAAVAAWLAETPGARLQFVRRPGRTTPGAIAFVIAAEEAQREVRRIELDRLDDLATIDLEVAGARVDTPLVLVCAHGSRDRCCARRGTAVFGTLAGRFDGEELWIASHLGGHRFAANVLVLPAGVQLGRVDESEAPFVVTRALAGRIELERYRGRTCYTPAVQAAEHAIRAASGLDGIDDLRLEAMTDAAVRFRSRDGTEWAALVEEVDGPVVPASCGSDPAPQRAFSARVL